MRRQEKLVLRKEEAIGGVRHLTEIGSTAAWVPRLAWGCPCAQVGVWVRKCPRPVVPSPPSASDLRITMMWIVSEPSERPASRVGLVCWWGWLWVGVRERSEVGIDHERTEAI